MCDYPKMNIGQDFRFRYIENLPKPKLWANFTTPNKRNHNSNTIVGIKKYFTNVRGGLS